MALIVDDVNTFGAARECRAHYPYIVYAAQKPMSSIFIQRRVHMYDLFQLMQW